MTHYFVTGATGMVGSALVPELIRTTSAPLTLLVRARDLGDLERRRLSSLAYWGWSPDDAAAQRLHFVLGDIRLPQFGLDAATWLGLADQATHLIHCAASVKLNMTAGEAQQTAVVPTRTLLDLARATARRGQLRKLDVVSTVGVWGRTPGLMPERPVPEVTEFHNTYESAKAEAERALWREAQDLPLTVHRPSMVVGDTGTGRARHFQVFYHLCEFLSGTRTFGVMPRLGDLRLDTVPVDWVAAAVAWSSQHPDAAGKVFHLCSGPTLSQPLPALQRLVRETWRAHGRPVPPLWTLPRGVLQALIPIIGALAGAPTRRALKALPPVLAYLGESQGFQNTETARILAAAGLPVPSPAQYLPRVLGHYLQVRASSPTA